MWIDNSETYSRILGEDIDSFLIRFSLFVEGDRNLIELFYLGEIPSIRGEIFDELFYLKSKASNLINSLNRNKYRFSNIEDWDLLEQLERIKTVLETTENLGFYLKSSIQKGVYSNSTQFELNIGQNQTIESALNREGLGNNSSDWMNLAVNNDLIEEDYTSKGQQILSLSLNKFNSPLEITTILGPLDGENLYGKDINKKFTFTNNDLEVLTPRETIKQSILIKLNLKRGENPEFREDGLQKNLILGNNIKALSYPIIFRQIASLFQKDDSIQSIGITNLKMVEDSLQLELDIKTQFGEIIKETANY